jgi:hypothetical protein
MSAPSLVGPQAKLAEREATASGCLLAVTAAVAISAAGEVASHADMRSLAGLNVRDLRVSQLLDPYNFDGLETSSTGC